VITVHHLDYSRSTRVVWLLEEHELPYKLVRYNRAVGGPAPKELASIHPLGKSPAIVDGDLVLAESSAILRYIDARYGLSKFTPFDVQTRAHHDEWLDFVEGSLAPALFVPLIAGSGLSDRVRAGFATQLANAWSHITAAVGDDAFLVGRQLTLADMQMSYVVAVASATGALKDWPRIETYLQRLLARPALVKAIAAGGPMA
jgi:glutathione S-transferase